VLDARKIDILVQWGIAKDPEISAYAKREVPLAQELVQQELVQNALVQNELDRRVLGFISSGTAIGRPLLAPPGVPPERVNMLRRAFDDTMKDAAFLADAARSNMEVKPLPGEALQTIAADVAQFPADGLARAKELISLDGAR
jgi:hypothetical protein